MPLSNNRRSLLHIVRAILFLPVLLLPGCALFRSDPSPEFAAQLAELSAHPELVRQADSDRFEASATRGRITFFGFDRDWFRFSDRQLRLVRENRDDAIALIRENLVHFPRLPRSDDVTVIEGKAYFELQSHLLLLIDLNASEELETLIDLAERISPPDLPKSELAQSIEPRRVPGIAVLSTILALLYAEGDPAVLNSEFAQRWRDSLARRTTTPEAEIARYVAFVPPGGTRLTGFDLREARFYGDEYPRLALTPSRAAAILKMARDFVERVPPGDRLRADAMLPEPFAR